MAENASRSSGSTRRIETTRGILSYAEIAPLIAERVLRAEEAINRGRFSNTPLEEDLLKELHAEICGDLVPDWSGKWRAMEVRVGTHSPPPPHLVSMQIRDYIADLNTRIENLEGAERLPELLAFAEGRLLSIHPFADFNGRVTRLWISELLRRLRLGPVILAPTEADEYLKALRAADARDFGPLANFWIQRMIHGE